MTDVAPLKFTANKYFTEMAVGDTITLGGLTMGGDIGMGGTHKVTALAAASSSGEAISYAQASASLAGLTLTGTLALGANKATSTYAPASGEDLANKTYVDTVAITGGRLKEAILDPNQFDNTDGINAAEVLFFAAQPSETTPDTVVVKNGTLTRTYTFVENIAGESAATDVSKETSAITAMQRFVTRFNADAGNTQWTAVWRSTGQERLNADGVIVIYEKASAAGASASRIYGVWGTQASCKVVQFASGATPTVDVQYDSETSVTLPAADPAAGRFGLRRVASALIDCEIHPVLGDDAIMKYWDKDSAFWGEMTGPGAITDATAASGGGTKGKITVDSDYGLAVSSGKLTINLAATPGLEFATGALRAKVDGVSTTRDASGQLAAWGTYTGALTASAAIAKGDPVYSTANDTVAKADVTDTAGKVLGIALVAQPTIGQPVKVVYGGPAVGVVSGATYNTQYWLADGGGLATTSPAGSGKRRIKVGTAMNATDLMVRVEDFGISA
jgi:hypothetical protein